MGFFLLFGGFVFCLFEFCECYFKTMTSVSECPFLHFFVYPFDKVFVNGYGYFHPSHTSIDVV